MIVDYPEGQGLILENYYSSIKRINRSATSRATPGESHATTGDSNSLHESMVYMTWGKNDHLVNIDGFTDMEWNE